MKNTIKIVIMILKILMIMTKGDDIVADQNNDKDNHSVDVMIMIIMVHKRFLTSLLMMILMMLTIMTMIIIIIMIILMITNI